MSSGIVVNFAPSLPLGVLLHIGDGLLLETITKFASHVTRENWREGSKCAQEIQKDRWWKDYTNQCNPHIETLAEWCDYVMIIGPPRARRYYELSERDEDYLTEYDDTRHFYPWRETWPACDDHSWCTGAHRTNLPEWVYTQYKSDQILKEKTEKCVWFPCDENGEPHEKNPYDQCGGFIFHNCTVEYYSIIWDDDDKEIKRGKNWQETQDLVYREFDLPENQGGCGGSWCEFEKRVNQLEEPDYYLIGQMRQRTGVWD
tara:strand:- start:1712 stop:2488 length:777 start_codon:yes stop_codon:yes gene_type:complete